MYPSGHGDVCPGGSLIWSMTRHFGIALAGGEQTAIGRQSVVSGVDKGVIPAGLGFMIRNEEILPVT